MITPRNVARHELVGLRCRVVGSSDPGRVCDEGVVVRETAGTLVLEGEDDDDDGTSVVPKEEVVLRFELPDGAEVRVDGETIDARPVERVRGV